MRMRTSPKQTFDKCRETQKRHRSQGRRQNSRFPVQRHALKTWRVSRHSDFIDLYSDFCHLKRIQLIFAGFWDFKSFRFHFRSEQTQSSLKIKALFAALLRLSDFCQRPPTAQNAVEEEQNSKVLQTPAGHAMKPWISSSI